MAIDVAITCYSGVQQQQDVVCGRAVTKMPGTRIFSVSPKINSQMSSGNLNRKYDARFDDLHYYT